MRELTQKVESTVDLSNFKSVTPDANLHDSDEENTDTLHQKYTPEQLDILRNTEID